MISLVSAFAPDRKPSSLRSGKASGSFGTGSFVRTGSIRRPGGDAAPSAPEDAAYAKELDDVAAERKRLTAALREAQESGDAGKLAAAADALNENRKRAAAAVREHVNLQSSKKQEK